MVIIRTSALAAIIQAVSAPSIFDAAACARAGEGAAVKVSARLIAAPATASPVFLLMMSPSRNNLLKRVDVGLTRANTYRLVDRSDEDFPVADLAGLGGSDDGFDHCVHAIRSHCHLDA